jgi:hypothetical protein
MYIREKVPCTARRLASNWGVGRSSRKSDTSRRVEGEGVEREGGERWIDGVRVHGEHHRLSIS